MKLRDPKLVALAKKYGRTPAQILIRWSLQRGFVCIPKSSMPERIAENADVFSWALDEHDMQALSGFNEGLITGWDPTVSP